MSWKHSTTTPGLRVWERSKLERLLDDYAEWQSFPSSQDTTRTDIRETRAQFEREIAEARKEPRP